MPWSAFRRIAKRGARMAIARIGSSTAMPSPGVPSPFGADGAGRGERDRREEPGASAPRRCRSSELPKRGSTSDSAAITMAAPAVAVIAINEVEGHDRLLTYSAYARFLAKACRRRPARFTPVTRMPDRSSISSDARLRLPPRRQRLSKRRNPGRRDRDHAHAAIVVARRDPDPLLSRRRLQVAGERGPVHAHELRQARHRHRPRLAPGRRAC